MYLLGSMGVGGNASNFMGLGPTNSAENAVPRTGGSFDVDNMIMGREVRMNDGFPMNDHGSHQGTHNLGLTTSVSSSQKNVDSILN